MAVYRTQYMVVHRTQYMAVYRTQYMVVYRTQYTRVVQKVLQMLGFHRYKRLILAKLSYLSLDISNLSLDISTAILIIID